MTVIKDPCKSAKCISYPMCMNRTLSELLSCETLRNFLNKQFGYSPDDSVVTRETKVWKHIINIFPKFNTKQYNKLSLYVLTSPQKSKHD